MLLFAVVVVSATEPALCIVAISAAGAFFYVIANGRHCWGRREGVGGSIAPCCMPQWNVRQLKRKQFESVSQITQQHLATCRKSCGKLQLQLSAPFVLFLCAIIIFKSFSEYSCNTHTRTQWQPQLHLPLAEVATRCLLGKPQIKQRNPGGACNQWRHKK